NCGRRAPMPTAPSRRWRRWCSTDSMKTKTDAREQLVLHGLGVSPGIAIGPAFLSDDGDIAVPERHLAPEEIPRETDRFHAGVALASKQLKKLKGKAAGLPDDAAEEVGYLLDAHLAMLANSRLVRGVARCIADERINAERAVQIEIARIAESFAAM